MKLRKYCSLVLAFLLLVSLLCGCSGKAMESLNGAVAPEMDYVSKDDMGGAESVVGSGESTMVMPENQKLIRTVRIDAETENLDALIANINQRIAQLGGYIEQQNIYNGSAYATHRDRYASMTVRIPADRLDEFVGHVGDVSNITSRNDSTENITLAYVATESRVKALQTEEERLLELLAMAKDMEDLLKIESRLTDVRTELEQVNSQLRLYDNQVNYGTIRLNLNEVVDYTVVEEPEGFFARIGSGFVTSLKNMGIFLRELVIFLVVAIPYLVIPVGVVVLLIVLIKRSGKKEKKFKKVSENQPE